MKFDRSDLNAQVDALCSMVDVAQRALGDNIRFDEHVGDERRKAFEARSVQAPNLRANLARYLDTVIQGTVRTHVPETFQDINTRAHMPPGIEPNQRVIRVERIDDALQRAGKEQEFDRTAFLAAMASATRDLSIVEPVVRQLNGYPGARPMFACFAAEVANEAQADDWLLRLLGRLGLGHHMLKTGETGTFALMQYTVADVLKEPGLDQRFAVPTVLEARSSEYFFPAPFGQKVGFAVDLDPAAQRAWVREFLHVRISYRLEHMLKAVSIVGPTPAVDLIHARDTHLKRVRTL